MAATGTTVSGTTADSERDRFRTVAPDELVKAIERSPSSARRRRQTDEPPILVNAYSQRFREGRPTTRWKQTIDKVLKDLGLDDVTVFSVAIEDRDSVLRRYDIRLRGVPALVLFRDNRPDLVQFTGEPDPERLRRWLERRLQLEGTRALPACEPARTAPAS